MALVITGKSTCALCGETILAEQEIVATPHFISDRSDPLWRFSDAAMHRKCFNAWEQRTEFLAKYEQTVAALRSLSEKTKTGTLAEYEKLLQELQRP